MQRMDQHSSWLAQGDVFRSVPVVFFERQADGQVRLTRTTGAAMLFTYDCQLDKPAGRAPRVTPRIKRLHFLPLMSVGVQPPERQGILRRDQIEPYEVFLVGDCPGDLGESFVALSEIYSIPADYFMPRLDEVVASDSPEFRLIATANDTRVATVEKSRLAILRNKTSAYWTGTIPDPAA